MKRRWSIAGCPNAGAMGGGRARLCVDVAASSPWRAYKSASKEKLVLNMVLYICVSPDH